MSAIVLSPNHTSHRALAREWYGLTTEQMSGLEVHHNPPVCEGGRNIPEHLFIYHPTLHKAVHEKHNKGENGWGGLSSGNKHGRRGRPATKTEPTARDREVYNLRKDGLNRNDIMNRTGLTEHQVKRCLREMVKFGYPPIKGRGRGGYKGCYIPCSDAKKQKISQSLRARGG